jgi:hypothetical protein
MMRRTTPLTRTWIAATAATWAACTPTAPSRGVPTGEWYGEGARLEIAAPGPHAELSLKWNGGACAHAEWTPLLIDRSGAFAVDVMLTGVGPSPTRARLLGIFDVDRLALEVSPPDGPARRIQLAYEYPDRPASDEGDEVCQ